VCISLGCCKNHHRERLRASFVQGVHGCCGECRPDAPCYKHFKANDAHPGVYVIDTTATKQPKSKQPQHMLRTLTTVNANQITLVSAEEEGPLGEPTIELLEVLHVRYLLFLLPSKQTRVATLVYTVLPWYDDFCIFNRLHDVKGFPAGHTAAMESELLRKQAIARCCPLQVCAVMYPKSCAFPQYRLGKH
jgi:hypothetical protein